MGKFLYSTGSRSVNLTTVHERGPGQRGLFFTTLKKPDLFKVWKLHFFPAGIWTRNLLNSSKFRI